MWHTSQSGGHAITACSISLSNPRYSFHRDCFKFDWNKYIYIYIYIYECMSLFCIRKTTLYFFFRLMRWHFLLHPTILPLSLCPFDSRGRALSSLSLIFQNYVMHEDCHLPAVGALQCRIFPPGTCSHNWPLCCTLRTWSLQLAQFTIRLKRQKYKTMN